MHDLTNKSILVSGGTSGIGRACVIELAGLGANVTFIGRDRARGAEVCAEAPTARFVAADLRESATAERAISAAIASFGRLDAAVNVAAALPTLLPLGDLDDAILERDLFDELRAFAMLFRAELRHLQERRGPAPSIVNVSSINGLGASPRAAAYSAVKAATIALTKSAALDYAGHGVRVNALVLGPFDTPMLRSAIDALAQGNGTARSEVERRYREMIPLGRIGEPREAAETVAWLLSESSSFVTGCSVVVDGGATCFAR